MAASLQVLDQQRLETAVRSLDDERLGASIAISVSRTGMVQVAVHGTPGAMVAGAVGLLLEARETIRRENCACACCGQQLRKIEDALDLFGLPRAQWSDLSAQVLN